MLIQIIKCNYQTYWYKELVGCRFTAVKVGDYYEVKHDGMMFFVDLDDAIELFH